MDEAPDVKAVVAPLEDHDAFLAEWTQLYASCPDAGFFQSPEWMTAWLAGAPEGAELYRVEVSENGAPKLMGAFAAPKRKTMGLGLREVWFQEFGDPARDAIYPEYLDFLAPRPSGGLRTKAAGAIMNYFTDADGFVFRNARMRMTSTVLSAAAGRGFSARVLREQPVYVCELGSTDFIAGLSKSLQTKIRRSIALYEERGGIKTRLAQTAEEKKAAFEKLKELHQQRWRARGREGVFANPHLKSFHERLRAHAPENLHLFEVSAGGETFAVLYNFVHGKRVMNYQSGFNIEDDNRVSPGFVAHALAAQFYQDKGFEAYDLLAGEEEYKARLGDPETILTSFVVERPTWRNRLRARVKG
ncbi:GNAT family N-acetyltransferase [Hyphococcus luteus]|nr:GNAT family N-acetyltransferase [Marinicaulis flavus]